MSASASPGWYHAQGDPPGTERYWDGTAWTEGPRPAGAAPTAPAASAAPSPSPTLGDPPPTIDSTTAMARSGVSASADTPVAPPSGFPGAPPSGLPPAGVAGFATYPESSSATAALVLSILGFFTFITAPIGVFMGFREKKAIDEGRRDPSKRGMAIAAIVIGLVALIGWLLLGGLVIALTAVALAA